MKTQPPTARSFVLDNLPTIAAYNAQGYGVYVYAIRYGFGFTPFTQGMTWNHDCGDALYVFPAFEGGAPEMVNDHWNLLEEDEQQAASKSGMDAAEYLESIGSGINERQIECWVEETRHNLEQFEVKNES